jgi:multicomponent Na+:H+ antiporter subunit B
VFAPHDPSHGQHWGILLVETGVTLTVAASFVAILVTFVRRARPSDAEGDAS